MRSVKKLGLLAVVWSLLATLALGANFTVTAVSNLATSRPGDGDVVTTLGYDVVGTGANSYYYDFDSAATVDYGFVINGPGGIGRYVAIDRSIARPEHFGARKHSTFTSLIFAEAIAGTPAIGIGFDSTVAIQRCMDAADANEVNVVFEPGLYFITDTIDLPTKSAWTLTSSTLHPVMKISGYGAEIRSNFNGPIFSHVPAAGEEDDTLTYWTLNIEGFHFWGPYDFEQAAAKTGVIGIYYVRGYSPQILDCRFTRCFQGIQQAFVIHGVIDRCRFDECSHGIRCAEGGGGYVAIRDCRFYSEDPQGIAYWFATGPGILDNSIVEGQRVKYGVRVGTDAATGGFVKLRQFHLECPALYAFKTKLFQYGTFDVDGVTISDPTCFVDSVGSTESIAVRIRDVYDGNAVIGQTAWSATNFAKYDRVQYSGTMYIANTASVAGDVPGVSGNWTSEGTYVINAYESTHGRNVFSLADSQAVDGRTWWLDATKWSGGLLPRHLRFDSPTKNASYWGWEKVDGKAHIAFTNGDTTPNVETHDTYITANTAPTTITDFDDRPSSFDAGPIREITIFVNDTNTTFSHGAGIKLNGGAPFTPTAKAVITFISHQNVWYEKSRAAY